MREVCGFLIDTSCIPVREFHHLYRALLLRGGGCVCNDQLVISHPPLFSWVETLSEGPIPVYWPLTQLQGGDRLSTTPSPISVGVGIAEGKGGVARACHGESDPLTWKTTSWRMEKEGLGMGV